MKFFPGWASSLIIKLLLSLLISPFLNLFFAHSVTIFIWLLFGSWITYDILYYSPCLVFWALFGSLVTKCMSCHKTIVVITRRAHCFYDFICILLILFLWHLSTLCVVDHLWLLILRSLLHLLSTLWFIGTSNL